MNSNLPFGDVIPSNCEITGNPCGTDTWMTGTYCHCKTCRSWCNGYHSAIKNKNQTEQKNILSTDIPITPMPSMLYI